MKKINVDKLFDVMKGSNGITSRNHRQVQFALKTSRGLTPRTSEASWLESNSGPCHQLELAIISSNEKFKTILGLIDHWYFSM